MPAGIRAVAASKIGDDEALVAPHDAGVLAADPVVGGVVEELATEDEARLWNTESLDSGAGTTPDDHDTGDGTR